MKLPSTLLLFLTITLGSGLPTSNANVTGHPADSFVPNEILVKYKPSLSRKVRLQAARAITTDLKELGPQGILQLRLPEGNDIQTVIDHLKNNPNVEFAQPNYIYHATAVPNDPNYSQLWGLKNTGQTVSASSGPNSPRNSNNPGISGKDMKLESAWDINTNCANVVIAVLDSGVNYNHSDLASNMWNGGAGFPNHGYDHVDNDNDPMDLNGHGTHVAGTIGARGNNGVGITGVCWNASIMAVRVLNALGSGTTANVISGINFAVANQAKIINLSLGGSNNDAAYYSALNNARLAGVLVVAAAGNDGINMDSTNNLTYPCAFNLDNILCVGALDQAYQIAAFSNLGVNSVDVAAPGVNILSTWPGSVSTYIDPLTSGWTMNPSTSSGFGYKPLTIGSTIYNSLVVPANYGNVAYSNNLDARAYKTFNLSGYHAAKLTTDLIHDVETYYDFVSLYCKSSSGDPIPSGSVLYTGSGNAYGTLEEDLTPYLSPTTTLGFRLTSDGTVTRAGMVITWFSIDRLTLNTSTYNVIEGTSMATPNTAGVAGLLMSFNPQFTYLDTINAIKEGGTSLPALSGVTVTGKSVSAQGALTYIAPPSNLTLTIQ
jgi:thermitase